MMAKMMGLGMTEIILILIVALVVIGPEKLPGLAYKLGKGWGEFRRTFDEVKDGFTTDIKNTATQTRQPPPSSARIVNEKTDGDMPDAPNSDTIDTEPDVSSEENEEEGPVG
jgi:Tat protein translocase TatB subunit